MTIGVLACGNLGMICLSRLILKNKIDFVMTDSKSESIVSFCRENNLALFTGNPRGGRARSFLNNFKTDIILSINYLFIVEKDILQHPLKLAINFHGSLLPKYRGRTPHVWAIINNESETGITAHIMTEGCDEGDILLQERILIPPDITGAGILDLFFNVYPDLIEKVLDFVNNNSVRVFKQDHTKATYFGQRVPEDGKINWNWQKERLKNWIRAQANPYPGAYTFYNQEKIIINKIEYSEYGYNYQDENGIILISNNNELIVKTCNGAIKILDLVAPPDIVFKNGEKFYG